MLYYCQNLKTLYSFGVLVIVLWLAATGLERKSHVQDKENDLITAYHEAGHALVAYFTDAAEPVHKVSILQRDKALGFVRICTLCV